MRFPKTRPTTQTPRIEQAVETLRNTRMRNVELYFSVSQQYKMHQRHTVGACLCPSPSTICRSWQESNPVVLRHRRATQSLACHTLVSGHLLHSPVAFRLPVCSSSYCGVLWVFYGTQGGTSCALFWIYFLSNSKRESGHWLIINTTLPLIRFALRTHPVCLQPGFIAINHQTFYIEYSSSCKSYPQDGLWWRIRLDSVLSREWSCVRKCSL